MSGRERVLPARGVRSLCWQGDDLVDWASGGTRYGADGRVTPGALTLPFACDAAVATPDGRFAVAYARLGTRAALLHEGRLLREVPRAAYHAADYEYPVALLPRPGGALLAHCPEQYNRLELEDFVTGERLTRAEREPRDFFHSRLAFSPSGRWLLSAGWCWHPVDATVWFDVAECLADPRRLDVLERCHPGSRHVGLAEDGAACWLDDERLLIGATEEEEAEVLAEVEAESPGELRLRARGLAVVEAATERLLAAPMLGEVSGPLMAAGPDRAVSFFGHPKLVELSSGRVLQRWEGIASGHQASAILVGRPDRLPPALALDPAQRRFAVAGPEAIHVVELG